MLEDIPEYHGPLISLDTPIPTCDHHALELDAFLRTCARRSIWLLMAALGAASAVVAGGVAENDLLASGGLLLIGLASLAFPFATPETVRRLGVVRSVRLVRGIGLVIVVVSLVAVIWISVSPPPQFSGYRAIRSRRMTGLNAA